MEEKPMRMRVPALCFSIEVDVFRRVFVTQPETSSFGWGEGSHGKKKYDEGGSSQVREPLSASTPLVSEKYGALSRRFDTAPQREES